MIAVSLNVGGGVRLILKEKVREARNLNADSLRNFRI